MYLTIKWDSNWLFITAPDPDSYRDYRKAQIYLPLACLPSAGKPIGREGRDAKNLSYE